MLYVDVYPHWEDFAPGGVAVEIEVGCGKGRFLLERATRYPDRYFMGIDYALSYLKVMKERAEKLGLVNVDCFRIEAAEFFRRVIPDQSISAFHLLYPDPWPKTKHHKRRLIQPEFLQTLRRKLIPGAEINIATDHEDYFQWMIRHFEDWKETFQLESKVVSCLEDLPGGEGRTNYEVKYIQQGRTLYLLNGHRTGF